jgi:hypothetical protein
MTRDWAKREGVAGDKARSHEAAEKAVTVAS